MWPRRLSRQLYSTAPLIKGASSRARLLPAVADSGIPNYSWYQSKNGPRRNASTASSSPPGKRRSKDAFRLFSLPYKFQIDDEALRITYREMMKKLHPDVQQHQNQNNDGSTRDADQLESSTVTDAYQTLKRPHLRAMHLLELLGHPLEQEDATSSTTTTDGIQEDFLMEIMELRFEIEAAASSDNDAALQPLFDANVQRVDETSQRLGAAIEAMDIAMARRLAGELQYWNRIDETLRDKMGSIER